MKLPESLAEAAIQALYDDYGWFAEQWDELSRQDTDLLVNRMSRAITSRLAAANVVRITPASELNV